LNDITTAKFDLKGIVTGITSLKFRDEFFRKKSINILKASLFTKCGRRIGFKCRCGYLDCWTVVRCMFCL